MGYTKLFSSILLSTVWREPDHVRLTWIALMALADERGEVRSSVPGLADVTRVTRAQLDDALERLAAPDPDSTNPAHEGRRIERADGGWRLLNHGYYKRLMSLEDRRQKDAERQRRHRSRSVTHVTEVTTPEQNRTDQIRTEGDPERARATGVSRIFSLPNAEPSKEYLDEALMRGVSHEQAVSTWEHYFGAGLPERGVERLVDWLCKRAKERAIATDKAQHAAPQPRGGAFAKGSPPLEPTPSQRAYAAKHAVDLAPLLAELAHAGVVDALGARGASEELTKRLQAAARKKGKPNG